MEMMGYLAPTINYGPEQIKKIPVLVASKSDVEGIVLENIKRSKEEWDSFETSWDFKKHPLI